MGIAEDRISYLPDSVLQIILTMMPLKSALRTDVLSQKWRNLWKYSIAAAQSLNLGEELACSLPAKQFVETVNRYISLNESERLERFHVFFCPFDLFCSDIERWISFAASKRVSHLDIDLSQGFRDPENGFFSDDRIPLKLPSSMFDCDSFVELKLSRCDFPDHLNLSKFGGLKSLSIGDCNLTEDELQSILTECSILESLTLRNCQELYDIRIVVPNLRLQRLTIGDCQSANLLEISAPKLRFFHYFGWLCCEDTFINISALQEASVYSIGRNVEHDYMKLLSELSHVEILTLCTSTLVHLNQSEGDDDNAFPIELINLQELQLLVTSMTNEDLTCFYSFFRLCSFKFLEKLFIRLPLLPENPNEEKYGVVVSLNPNEVLNCTALEHLKIIKLMNFKGSMNEMRLVSYLLQKAQALESLIAILPPANKEEGNGEERMVLRVLRGQLSLLQKASYGAQIIINEFGEDDGCNPMHSETFNDYSGLPFVTYIDAGYDDE